MVDRVKVARARRLAMLKAIFGTEQVGPADWVILGGCVALVAIMVFGIVVGIWASVTM